MHDLKPIKRVIKHLETNLFYAGDGKWTRSWEEAEDFKSITEVYEAAHTYGLKKCCVLIFKFDGTEYDANLLL